MLRLILSSFVIIILGGIAASQEGERKLVIPSDNALAIIIKATLSAYNDGNVTGNYSVLRDLASPIFREANSPARLADVFQDMRRRKMNIAPILLLQPQLLREPEIDADGHLILEGFFETRPEQVEFLLVYEATTGPGRLFAIRVSTRERRRHP